MSSLRARSTGSFVSPVPIASARHSMRIDHSGRSGDYQTPRFRPFTLRSRWLNAPVLPGPADRLRSRSLISSLAVLTVPIVFSRGDGIGTRERGNLNGHGEKKRTLGIGGTKSARRYAKTNFKFKVDSYHARRRAAKLEIHVSRQTSHLARV